jgi:hypothetical protein
VKARRDDDFASEIEAHIALDAEPLVDGGLSPDQANAEASRRFGNVTAAREGPTIGSACGVWTTCAISATRSVRSGVRRASRRSRSG